MLKVSSISFDEKFLDVYIDEEAKLETEMTLEFDDVVLMQSTGLFDKNGKEIFEGDVVFDDFQEKNVSIGLHKLLGIYIQDKDGTRTYYNFTSEKELEGLTENLKQVEIIGNLYENPDLVAE